MGFFGVDLNNLPEIGPVPKGEYDLEITATKDHEKFLSICLDVCGEDSADDVWYKVWKINPDDPIKKQARNKQEIMKFLEAFNMSDFDDPDELLHAHCTAQLDTQPSYKNPSIMENYIVSFS